MRVPGPLAAPVTAGLAAGQTLLMVLMPHGGQHVARRNAWSGMVVDAQRARAHREATAAVDLAVAAARAREQARTALPTTGSR